MRTSARFRAARQQRKQENKNKNEDIISSSGPGQTRLYQSNQQKVKKSKKKGHVTCNNLGKHGSNKGATTAGDISRVIREIIVVARPRHTSAKLSKRKGSWGRSLQTHCQPLPFLAGTLPTGDTVVRWVCGCRWRHRRS